MSSNSAHRGAGSTSRGAKSKQSKTIILKVPSSTLLQFPHEKTASKASSTKSPPSESSSTQTPAVKEPSPAAEVRAEANPDATTEPTPDNAIADGETQPEGKRKGLGGPKPGQKRRLGALNDGPPKQRARPGPKRRKPDGDDSGRPWTTPAAGGPGHKLGPKANQGAINAGLRALDRTGKPTRKWAKSGFAVKSFTGTLWALHSWAAPRQPQDSNGDNAENVTPNSTSENQQGSSNVGSEVSQNQAPDMKPELISSPAAAAAPA